MANISEEKKSKKVTGTKSAPKKKQTKTTTKPKAEKKVEVKEVVKAEVVNEKKVEETIPVIDRSKQILPRLAAYVIDMLIIAMLISLLSSIKFLNPNYDKYVEATNRYNKYYTNYIDNNISLEEFTTNTENVTYELYKYGTTNYVIAFVVVVGYLVVFQKYNNGQTIGKRLMKLKVVTTGGKDASIKSYIIRVAPLFILTYGGVFSIIACIILPHVMTASVLGNWITAVTIANCLLGLIDAEFAIARRDKRAMHDLLSNTKIVSE